VGAVAGSALTVLHGRVYGGPSGHLVVALVAESRPLFDKTELLGILVIFVAGGAVAAVGGVVR
jgi:hypothetical protein